MMVPRRSTSPPTPRSFASWQRRTGSDTATCSTPPSPPKSRSSTRCPHQRIAVYEHMLPQPRLRFLLADEPGGGKTIMAGLYIREMLARRLIRRILIVPPAGLIGNWERELRTLFGLDFRIIGGADSKADNPFRGPNSDLLIVSVDTLAGERTFARLQEPAVEPYDLCIFDEAHKLSRRPPARLHDPHDRSLPGRRGPGGRPQRRSPLVARLGVPPPAAADRHAAHGQGLSRTTRSGGCWSPMSCPRSMPSTPTRPMPAAATSSAGPRRRWSISRGSGSTRTGSATP